MNMLVEILTLARKNLGGNCPPSVFVCTNIEFAGNELRDTSKSADYVRAANALKFDIGKSLEGSVTVFGWLFKTGRITWDDWSNATTDQMIEYRLRWLDHLIAIWQDATDDQIANFIRRYVPITGLKGNQQ